MPINETVNLFAAGSGLVRTVGLPLKESFNVLDVTTLRLKQGATILAATFTVGARWKGLPSDTSKPLKWVHVTFKDTGAPRTLVIDDAGGTVPAQTNPLVVTNNAGDITVSNGVVTAVFNKTTDSADLLTSFLIGASETLHATNKPRLTVPIDKKTRVISEDVNTHPGVAATNTIKVADAGRFVVGDVVDFQWEATVLAGATTTRVPFARPFGLDRISPGTLPKLTAIVNPGGSQQTQVIDFVGRDGLYFFNAPLISAPAAGQLVRIQSVEAEANKTISAINYTTNTLTFSTTLAGAIPHGTEVVCTVPVASTANAQIVAGGTTIEKQYGDKAVIIKQDLVLKSGANRINDKLDFVLRHYVYADTGFVRSRITLRNRQTDPAAYECHANWLKGLKFAVPTAVASSVLSDAVTDMTTSVTRYKAGNLNSFLTHSGITNFQWAAHELGVQFPNAINLGAAGCEFDLFPETAVTTEIEGSIIKSRDVFWGVNASAGLVLPDSLGATFDAAYIANSKAVRPNMVEKRDWATYFAAEPQKFKDACAAFEKQMAVVYDVTQAVAVSAGRPAMSLYEYRWDYVEKQGSNNYPFGWDRWGNTPDDVGFGNNRFDLPFIAFREGLREPTLSKAELAFKIGFQQIRHRMELGQYWSNKYFNGIVGLDLKGMARYERAYAPDPFDYYSGPTPTHSWNEGTCLYWALTDDPIAYEAAKAGVEQARQYNYQGTANARLFGTGFPNMGSDGNAGDGAEPRYVGWPIHNLITGYRYFGEAIDLTRATEYSQCFPATAALEVDDGFINFRYGTTLAPLFQHGGYCVLGIIETWRELPTGATKTALGNYIVKVARFLQKGDQAAVGVTANAPLLTAGTLHPTDPTKYNAATHLPMVYKRSFADTLASGISNSVTTIPLVDASSFNMDFDPDTGRKFGVLMGDIANPATWEYFIYTGVSGNNLTGVTRGYSGTPAAAFSAGAVVYPTGFNRIETDIVIATIIMGGRIANDSSLQALAQKIWEDNCLYTRNVGDALSNPNFVTVGAYHAINLWPLNVGTNGLKTTAQAGLSLSEYLGDRVNPPAAPILTSLSPNSATAGAATLTMTVNGSNFESDAEVLWNGSPIATVFVNSTQVTASINSSLLTTAGTRTVQVRNVAAATISNTLTFTINAPPSAPTISGMAPNTAITNVATGAITITGTNLTSATVTVDGVSVTPTSNSATQIVLPTQTFTTTGSKAVVVTTTGGTANTSITVSAPAPTISSRTPTTAVQNVATGPITIIGTNLGSASVTIDGVSVTPTSNSATQIVLPTQTFTTVGTKTIAVTTTGGTVNTTITVNAPAPPPTPTTGGITLQGATNVVLGSWAGQPAVINTAPTGGANSTEQIPAGKTGYIQVQLLTQKQDTHVGISAANTGTNAAAINFALRFKDDYTLEVKASGTVIYATGTAPNQIQRWETGDQFQIYVERDRLLFMHEWKVFHSVARPTGVAYRFAVATNGLTTALGNPLLRVEGAQ